MATSWFAIDEDGIVAVLHFDDNGPVPRGTVQDSDIDCEAGEYYFTIDHDDENQESQSGYMYVYEGKYDPRWPLKRICSPNFVTKQYKDW